MLADTCIDIDNLETFHQWASAAQKHHRNWLCKRAIHGEYGQDRPHTNPATGNRVPRYRSPPRNSLHPQLPPSDPDAMDTSATVQSTKIPSPIKVVKTQESKAMTPCQIAKILQAYNDDERNLFIKVMQEEDNEMGFSSCLGTMALIRACNSPDSVYVAKKKSIHTSLLLHTSLKKAMKKALLDTGATENFIHPCVVKQLSLWTKKLTKPQRVKNMDGTLDQSSEITDAVTLIVTHNRRPMQHLFFVANIASDDLILGYPFFEDANLLVLWKEGRLKGTLTLATVQKPEEYRDTIPLWLRKATMAM
jgi:Aspartyl protease